MGSQTNSERPTDTRFPGTHPMSQSMKDIYSWRRFLRSDVSGLREAQRQVRVHKRRVDETRIGLMVREEALENF